MKVEPWILKLKYSKIATTSGKPEFKGPPDSILFRRQEQCEVIPMLQTIVDDLSLKKESDVWDLEDLINRRLPTDIKTREDVYSWLIANFNKISWLRSLKKTIDKYIDDVTCKDS